MYKEKLTDEKCCQNFYIPQYQRYSYIFLRCHNINEYEQEQTIYSSRLDLKFMFLYAASPWKIIYFRQIDFYTELLQILPNNAIKTVP